MRFPFGHALLLTTLLTGCGGSSGGDSDGAGSGGAAPAQGGSGTGGTSAAGGTGGGGAVGGGSGGGGSGTGGGGGTGGTSMPTPGLPGVVVTDNEAGTTKCYPLCTLAMESDGDDWSWEHEQSCVIPGTLTGHNTTCTTGEPIPPPEPRPGVLVSDDSGATEGVMCAPLCRVATEPTTAGADWAYEDNESCVLPATATAMGRRACTYGEEPDYTPPALTGTKLTDGFSVKDGLLYDAYGGEFVMRGVNNAHAWFDGYAQYYAWQALDNIQSYGTNTIRVVWDTKSSPALLADVLHRIVELKMVPMVELHDSTGIRTDESLLTTAAYWTKPEVLAVLEQFRAYLLVNIANEWSGGDSYSATYTTVIGNLRAAGIRHTLVIDASGYGQNAQSLVDAAPVLLEADPEHNLLFSIHMYDLFTDPARVDSVLEEAKQKKIPYIVGEFGTELNGKAVAWSEILAKCQELGLGYIAWSWMGNDSDTAHLDMADAWEGPLTTWGHDVMDGANGITATAKRASIFD